MSFYNIHVYYIHILKDELCIQICYIWKNHVLSICKYLNNWHPRVFQTLTHKGVSTSVSAQVREKKKTERECLGGCTSPAPHISKSFCGKGRWGSLCCDAAGVGQGKAAWPPIPQVFLQSPQQRWCPPWLWEQPAKQFHSCNTIYFNIWSHALLLYIQ